MTRSGSKRLLTTPRSVRPDHRGTIHTRFLGHTHIYIYYIIYYIYILYITKGLKNITDSLFGSKDDLFWPANRMIGPAERMDIRWIMGMGVWGWYCPWESQITTLPWKLTFESIKTMKKGPHVFFSALWVFLLNFWGMPKNAPQSGWFQMLKHV